MLVGCGGEAVVEVHSESEFGCGGPNQQAALRAAEVLAGTATAALFLDTDGSDGGTPFAGALVDGDTADLARELGVDLRESRRRQRSTAACEALGVALRTGHTGTNVNDLFVLAAQGAPDELADTDALAADVRSLHELRLERVTKRFGDVRAVDDVDLTIGAGEFFSLLGPSGCGKTTTLRLVAGFEQPSSGRILVGADDVTRVVPPSDL